MAFRPSKEPLTVDTGMRYSLAPSKKCHRMEWFEGGNDHTRRPLSPLKKHMQEASLLKQASSRQVLPSNVDNKSFTNNAPKTQWDSAIDAALLLFDQGEDVILEALPILQLLSVVPSEYDELKRECVKSLKALLKRAILSSQQVGYIPEDVASDVATEILSPSGFPQNYPLSSESEGDKSDLPTIAHSTAYMKPERDSGRPKNTKRTASDRDYILAYVNEIHDLEDPPARFDYAETCASASVDGSQQNLCQFFHLEKEITLNGFDDASDADTTSKNSHKRTNGQKYNFHFTRRSNIWDHESSRSHSKDNDKIVGNETLGENGSELSDLLFRANSVDMDADYATDDSECEERSLFNEFQFETKQYDEEDNDVHSFTSIASTTQSEGIEVLNSIRNRILCRQALYQMRRLVRLKQMRGKWESFLVKRDAFTAWKEKTERYSPRTTEYRLVGKSDDLYEDSSAPSLQRNYYAPWIVRVLLVALSSHSEVFTTIALAYMLCIWF